MEPLLTINELADLAGLSEKTIRRKIAQGEIETMRLGPNSIRIRPEEARRFLQHPDTMEETNREES